MARKILQDLILDKKKREAANQAPRKKDVSGITEHKSKETMKKEEKKTHKAVEKPHIDSGEKNEKFERPSFRSVAGAEERRNKKVIWLSAGGTISAIAVIFVLGTVFAGASIQVTPKKSTVPLNAQFTANKNGSRIPFEIMMVKGSETRSVKATGTEYVERKASGKIVVYNTYNQTPQKLIKNTRFEATNGKVYRIQNNITVPGMRQVDGELIPGSVETTVYASEPGAAYNIGLTDFTIPGFKGDPRYDKFYARSKTEMTGGFSGVAPIASEKDLEETKKSIETSLKEDLLHEAGSQVPEGYVFYADSAKIDFEEIKDISDDPKSVVLSETGNLVGVLLKKDSLVSEITKQITLSSKETLPFTANSPESLKFSFQGGTPNLGTETKEINFSLSGNTDIVYSVDENALAKDLKGKPKSDFQKILSSYQTVYKAKIVSFRPFWARSFPGKDGKISISVTEN